MNVIPGPSLVARTAGCAAFLSTPKWMTEGESMSLPILDVVRVMRDMNDDGEIYREVATVFLEDARPQRERLERVAGDPAAAIAAIHEVANSLGIIGALRGEQAVRQAEHRLFDNGSVDVHGAVRLAIEALAEAEVALTAWLRAHP